VSQSQSPRRKPPSPKLGQSQTKPWVRVVIVLIVVVLGLGSVAALFLKDDSSSGSGSTDSSTLPPPSTVPALASAAGKPCVAVADPLPTGAPQVPVPVGPPPTQLVTQDLVAGTGAPVAADSTITLDYIGVACSSGKIIDATYGSAPVTYPLAQFIPGWQQGIPGMKVGGTRLLGIPPDLAYGSQGGGADIAPDETLWFVVQVKDVKPPAG
jgi:peptidylprolyl isomerase